MFYNKCILYNHLTKLISNIYTLATIPSVIGTPLSERVLSNLFMSKHDEPDNNVSKYSLCVDLCIMIIVKKRIINTKIAKLYLSIMFIGLDKFSQLI